jgi:hypothetical protein
MISMRLGDLTFHSEQEVREHAIRVFRRWAGERRHQPITGEDFAFVRDWWWWDMNGGSSTRPPRGQTPIVHASVEDIPERGLLFGWPTCIAVTFAPLSANHRKCRPIRLPEEKLSGGMFEPADDKTYVELLFVDDTDLCSPKIRG